MGEGTAAKILCCIMTVGLSIAALTTLLVVTAYDGVEFYEYGFIRRKSTSEVFTEIVFQSGFDYIGLDYEFKIFKADAHIVDLDGVAVFTRDRLEVQLDCTMQYFLRPEELAYLHDTYDLLYNDTIRYSAIDALKGVTGDFTTREFGVKRAMVEETLFRAVRKRLGGTCCKLGCVNLPKGCEPGCKPREDCTQEDLGFYVDVRYFQLRFVKIPDIVLDRNIQTLTQLEDGVKETYIQQAALVRKLTEERVYMVQNSAEEITQNATTIASLIGSQARADARARVETSHNRGLAKIYNDLNITSQDHKASLNYIRTLRDHETVVMSVNFNSLVTGPINGGN
ncbi:uncharacterized protein LOC117291453 [Asterias rubens]|uniref:uncharacterized protein LOC117291453 n=1 Tax=Asterias rubens TaxID=7604 RepID=UPI001455B5F4|nr:uncharacterized protein LOC117291453 [Asterias rubens]